MTSASSLAFPGSRPLATWWRQLASFEPVALSFGYFFVHRLEAPAAWLRSQSLDPLSLLVLEAVGLQEMRDNGSADYFRDRLQRRVPLDLPILRRLTRTLEQSHLVECRRSADSVVHGCRPTEQGQEALRTGKVPLRQWRRDTFTFVERLGPTGQRLAEPHFLPLADAPAALWLADDAASVTVSHLCACLKQTPQWKSTFGFPFDVEAFPEWSAGSAVLPEQVIVNRPERLLAVFCQTREQELLGFGVQPEGWALNDAEPITRLPAAAASVLGLERSAAAPIWKQAWSSWCQAHGLPRGDAEACSLTLVDERLQIAASEEFVRILHAGKGDPCVDETWILAGDGYARQAARIDML